MPLRNENLFVEAIPSAAPVLISPTKTKRQIKVFIVQIILDRCFQQSLATEPVKIKTKAFHSIEFGQFNLPSLYGWIEQVVIAKLSRHMRLIVLHKLRLRGLYIHPFSETLSPPFVVFGDCVKLWQVKTDEFNSLALKG